MNSKETIEERIVRLYMSGKTIYDIRRITKHCFDKVNDTIKYFLRFGTIPAPPKRGRPTHLTNHALTTIAALTVQNRMASCFAISQQLIQNGVLHCSPTTVWRGRQMLHFNYKPPKTRQHLTLPQKEKRVNFANSMLLSDFDFSRIIFSDESRFCLGPDNKMRWYRRGESTPDCFEESDKYNVSVMVYGAIGIGYKSKLVLCSDGVDNVEYRKIINESGMIDNLDRRYGQGCYTFMQDGAPAHKSALTTLFLKKRCSFINCWPANSPDLNPIEHLWGAMKRILKTKAITTKNELIDAINDIWDSFPQSSIDSLVCSFRGRLLTVIDQEGESISDILRSGIHSAPQIALMPNQLTMPLTDMITACDPTVDDNPVEMKSQRAWTLEEDILLLNSVKEFGTRWAVIAPKFTDRTSNSCRSRYMYISKRK